MHQRLLGTTTLSVSPIALGTMQFLWSTSEEEAYNLLDDYYNAGGNFVDTADMYTQWAPGCSGGDAERIIGSWMKKRKNREKIVLSSKVRSRMWKGPYGEGLSRKHIFKACDDSLKRLQTDYLDLYFSHWPDETTPEEETLSAYHTLIKQGKVRFIGCSNYTPTQLSNALYLQEQGLPSYQVIQTLYNLVDRQHFEKELLPLVKRYSLGVLAYSPLASGFLSGLFEPYKPFPNHPRADFIKSKMTPSNIAVLSLLKEIASSHHATASQIALAWLLEQETITGLITGADTTEQLRENLGALQIHLTAKEVHLLSHPI